MDIVYIYYMFDKIIEEVNDIKMSLNVRKLTID